MQHFDIFQGNLGHPQICLFAVKRQTNEQTWVRRKRADQMQLVAQRDRNIFDLVDKSQGLHRRRQGADDFGSGSTCHFDVKSMFFNFADQHQAAVAVNQGGRDEAIDKLVFTT